MNTPLNKRCSSSSEYATPGAVDDPENSLYYSFTVDGTPSNKENSINGGQWAITDLIPSSSTSKTPLLRKVLQSNFTPRNDVLFSRLSLQKPQQEHQTDLDTIRESLPCPTIEIDQKIFDEYGTEQDASLEDEIHNTIIENPSSVNHSIDSYANMSEQPELNACGSNQVTELNKMKNMQSKHSNNDCKPSQVKEKLSEAVKKSQQTRNVRSVRESRSRKSVLPVAKKPVAMKPVRATTYKRRSSTYEPRKVLLSKAVSGK